MRKLHEIAEDLRTELSQHYRTVRVSSLQTTDQFLKEISAINTDNLPAVIITFDSLVPINESGISETRFTLVLIDKFKANSDEKALSVFKASALLLDLYPAEGRDLNGVFVTPMDCIAASPDGAFAALALGIVCKQ